MTAPYDAKLESGVPPPGSEMNLVEDIQAYFTQPNELKSSSVRIDNIADAEVDPLVNDIVTNNLIPKPAMMRMGKLLATSPANTTNCNGKQGSYLLYGCDSFATAHYKCMNNAIRQVASQFNSGEGKGPQLTLPSQFKNDRYTQGPNEQRTCGSAAMARYAYRDDCDFFGLILSQEQTRSEFLQLFDYKFGYLTAFPGKEQSCLDFLHSHIGDLVLNVERVLIDDTDPPVYAIQVLNASMALGAYDAHGEKRTPQGEQILKEINKFFLDNQYMAVAKIAILEAAANPAKRIPVSFTMLGGGAFGADPMSIAFALNRAIQAIKASNQSNIDICVSCWSQEEKELYTDISKNNQCSDLYDVFTGKVLQQHDLETRPELTQPCSAEKGSLQKPHVDHADHNALEGCFLMRIVASPATLPVFLIVVGAVGLILGGVGLAGITTGLSMLATQITFGVGIGSGLIGATIGGRRFFSASKGPIEDPPLTCPSP